MGFEVITSPYSPEIAESEKKRLLKHYKELRNITEVFEQELINENNDFIKKRQEKNDTKN